jgi:hypothetical protein
MTPEDVKTVRAVLDPQSEFELDEEWREDETAEDEPTVEGVEVEEALAPEAEIEAEISRLEAEIAVSRQRQQALERFLEALDG